MKNILTKEDLRSLKFLNRQKTKHPDSRFFVASKRGGNAKGDGANRSVILGSRDGNTWYQAVKVWGENNEQRAYEIIRLWKENNAKRK